MQLDDIIKQEFGSLLNEGGRDDFIKWLLRRKLPSPPPGPRPRLKSSEAPAEFLARIADESAPGLTRRALPTEFKSYDQEYNLIKQELAEIAGRDPKLRERWVKLGYFGEPSELWRNRDLKSLWFDVLGRAEAQSSIARGTEPRRASHSRERGGLPDEHIEYLATKINNLANKAHASGTPEAGRFLAELGQREWGMPHAGSPTGQDLERWGIDEPGVPFREYHTISAPAQDPLARIKYNPDIVPGSVPTPDEISSLQNKFESALNTILPEASLTTLSREPRFRTSTRQWRDRNFDIKRTEELIPSQQLIDNVDYLIDNWRNPIEKEMLIANRDGILARFSRPKTSRAPAEEVSSIQGELEKSLAEPPVSRWATLEIDEPVSRPPSTTEPPASNRFRNLEIDEPASRPSTSTARSSKSGRFYLPDIFDDIDKIDEVIKQEFGSLLSEGRGDILRWLKGIFRPKPKPGTALIKRPSASARFGSSETPAEFLRRIAGEPRPRGSLRLPAPGKPAGLLTGPEGWQRMEQRLPPSLTALRNAEITIQGGVPRGHEPVSTVGEITNLKGNLNRQWRRSQLRPGESYANKYHNATPYRNMDPDPNAWGDGTELALKDMLHLAGGTGGRELDPLVYLTVKNIIRNRLKEFQLTLRDARKLWQSQPFPWKFSPEDVLGQSGGTGSRTKGAIGRLWNEAALTPIRKDLKELSEYLGFLDPKRGVPVKDMPEMERFRIWGDNSQKVLENIKEEWKTTWETSPEPGFETLTLDDLRDASRYMDVPKYPFDIDPLKPPVESTPSVSDDLSDPIKPLREGKLLDILEEYLIKILKDDNII